MASSEAPGGPGAYDLTHSVSKFLDRHLVLPLLEFLQVHSIYPESEIVTAKIALLERTNMLDFAMDMYKSLHGKDSVPDEMSERRKEVIARMKTLMAEVEPLVVFLSDPKALSALTPDRAYNLQYLQEQHGIGPERVEALYHYAKWQFDCGNYSAATEFLYHYRTLATDPERVASAMWGKLAAEILMQDWDAALEDLNRLKDMVDSKGHGTQEALAQLQQRTWLMHWSLYIFFNHENGRNLIVDLFFQERYMNAIQTNAPHLLRYLATAVVINKRRSGAMKDLVRVIQTESFADPVLDFLRCLFVSYDFEGAQKKLRECETVLQNDFFLVACKDEFVECARLSIFETYCRIHQCIEISMLADKLNMGQADAERWIVDLVRNAHLDAKIDSQAGTVIMGNAYPTVYESLVEKTKGLTFRTYSIGNHVLAEQRARAQV